jgi:anti-sigma factor RsiW
MAKQIATGSRRQPSITKCRQATALVTDYLNDDLAPGLRAAFEQHLRSCSDCRAFLATYKQTVAAMHALQYDEMPPGLQKQALAALSEKLKKKPHKR